MPTLPGTTVPLLNSKGGDVGVILAGIAAFILVGLYARAEPRPRLPEPLPWVPWLVGAGVVSSRQSRWPGRHVDDRPRRCSSSVSRVAG